MENFYQDLHASRAFADFSNSANGQQQHKILLDAILARLPHSPSLRILDAACGTGWLATALAEKSYQVTAFDSSAGLIGEAKKNVSRVQFDLVDAGEKLPYEPASFDCIILNMAAHDLADQLRAYKNFYQLLKQGGQLIVTIANPYYAFPVGVWKRGLTRFLLRLKPLLRLRPYNYFARDKQSGYEWKKNMLTRFYPMSAYLNNPLQAGFQFTHFQDLESKIDSPVFDASFQLYRFPLLLLMEFTKP